MTVLSKPRPITLDTVSLSVRPEFQGLEILYSASAMMAAWTVSDTTASLDLVTMTKATYGESSNVDKAYSNSLQTIHVSFLLSLDSTILHALDRSRRRTSQSENLNWFILLWLKLTQKA